MKRLAYFSFSFAFLLMLTGCDKFIGSSAGYEVEAFAFQEEDGGKYGLMDLDGKVIVKAKFENSPSAVVNGRFTVYDGEGYQTLYTAETKPRKIGTYKDIAAFTGKYCPVVDKKGKIRYIDKDGNDAFDMKTVSKKKVVSAFAYFDGRAMVKIENGKWGFIDENGEPVIPIKYADAWNFADGLAIVYLDLPYDNEDGKWAVIDTDGNTLFTKKFKDMTPSDFRFYGDYMMATDKNDQYVIIDREGKVVKKLKDNYCSSPICDGKFVYYDAGSEKNGLMNVEGEVLVKDKYSLLQYNGKLLVGTTDATHFTLLTQEGEKIAKLPKGSVLLFDPVFKKYDKRILVGEYDKGYVLMDEEGNELDIESEIHDYSTGFSWGVGVEEEEEYDEGYAEGDEGYIDD